MTTDFPHPDAPLVLAPTVDLRLEQGRAPSVLIDGFRHVLADDALAVIAAARVPRSFRQLVDALGASTTGAVAWIEATRMLARLIELGVLVPATRAGGGDRRRPASPRPGNREIAMHIELLDDVARTHAFVSAIQAHVRPGDVVVDLGTGNGVLAMAAARAGAARVYAIEASDFADVAEETFARNGFAETIRVVRGWSHHVELPELADVLVSEIIGNDPLGEGALRYMPDAARRFLRPGARVLPSQLSVSVQLVDVPPARVAELRVGGDRLRHWLGEYGFDFGAFEAHARRVACPLWVRADLCGDWAVHGPSRRLFRSDLGTALLREGHLEWVQEVPADCHNPGLAVIAHLAFALEDGAEWIECAGHWRRPVHLLPAGSINPAVRASWGSLAGAVEISVRPDDET